MGALNLPSAADIDRLTRRLRTVGTRLEGIEEALDRLQDGVDRLVDAPRLGGPRVEPELADRVAAIEGQLSKLVNEVGHVSVAIDAGPRRSPRAGAAGRRRGAGDKPKPRPAATQAGRAQEAPGRLAEGGECDAAHLRLGFEQGLGSDPLARGDDV